MKILYAIGHRGTNEYRLNNLLKVIQWIKKFDIVPLVIEQDDSPKIKDKISCDYLFIKNSGLYNRSWAFNVAHHYTDYDYIGCADNDMMIKKEDFNKVIETIKENKHDVIKPFNNLYDLLPNESTYETIKNIKENKRNPRGAMNLSSGIIFFKKESLIKIGGWDERFRGWGGEDDKMTKQINKNKLSVNQMNFDCFHLYHPRSKNDGTHLHEHYNENLKYINDETSFNIENLGKRDKYE